MYWGNNDNIKNIKRLKNCYPYYFLFFMRETIVVRYYATSTGAVHTSTCSVNSLLRNRTARKRARRF